MDNKNDVDLYEELRNTLDKSEEEETSGASDQKTTEDIETSESKNNDENSEMSEEEISKLTPRAQKRIRELAEKVKELAEKTAEDSPKKTPETEDPNTHQNFNNVQEFLSAVEDDASRDLLEKFYGVMKGEISSTLSPLEESNNKARFEKEFSQYEKIEGISDYKNDLQKTFLRNPNVSIKQLVGEVVTDLQLSKVKPIEKKTSTPNRDGKVDISDLSTEELYERLDSLRG
jgi:hypothetical protein